MSRQSRSVEPTHEECNSHDESTIFKRSIDIIEINEWIASPPCAASESRYLTLNCLKDTSKELIYNYWIAEILAYVVGIIRLLMIVLVLKCYEGQAQPHWSHNITLNSVLSWLKTLFKAAILFPTAACIGQAMWIHYHLRPNLLRDVVFYDSASRGPIGALESLFSLPKQSVK